MAMPPEFARYGEKCPRTGEDHLIGTVSCRCMHCNGKAVGWTWARVDAAQKARVALPIVTGPAPFAEQPETTGYFEEVSKVSIDAWNRLKSGSQPLHVVSMSNPSVPDTWDAAFTDPPPQGYEAIKGWTSVDVIPPPQSFQQVDAENQRAMLANPPRARLTCDRNGLDDPSRNDLKPILRPGERAYLTPRPSDAADATAYMMTGSAQRQIAELKARIAVLETDNKVLEARKDAVLDQYAAASTAAMRHTRRILDLQAERDGLAERLDWMRNQMRAWRTKALQRAIELGNLKRHQSPHLPESEKPSQDAVWRNATRFSR